MKPGGVSDITARLMADPLAASWGQPVPVENRAGADGVIGSEALARSTPRRMAIRWAWSRSGIR